MFTCVAMVAICSIQLQMPYTTQPNWIESTDSGITMDVCLFDVDNDNDLDAVTAQYDYENGARLYLYLNEDGVLSRDQNWEASPLACFECVTAGDMNNDGFMDVIAGTVIRFPGDGHNYIYYNNNGSLSESPGWTSTDSKDTYSIQAMDYDRDGLLELVTANQSFRLLFYEHDDGGLSTSPDDVFGVCNNTTAAIGKFIGINGVAEEGMQMLAGWAYNDDMITGRACIDIYELEELGSTYPPDPLWPNDLPYNCRFNWAVDLNEDGLTDWIGNSGSVLRRGICENGVLDLTLKPILLPCTEGQIYDPVYRVYYADIDLAIDNGPEIIVAAPGIIDPASSENDRTMLHASNRVFTIDNWTADQPELSEIWVSGISNRSTTAIAVGDINSDGLILTNETVIQSVSNQSYLLNGGLPIEYVEFVAVNGNPVQFHCDRNRGLLSLIRNVSPGSLPVNVRIEYFISYKQDLFCAMVGHNVVYYHQAR